MRNRIRNFCIALKKYLPEGILFILFLSLFLVVFREFFFSSRTFYERDLTLLEIPSRKLCAKLLREGNFALWTDAHGNGQPFLANPKNAVFYPTTWLYLVLPFFTAFKFHYLIHVLIGWGGLYILTRSFNLTRSAAFLGSSLFFFSGMHLSSFEFYNHIAALAWMPWVLFALNKNGWSKRRKIISSSFLWALLILAGTPEVILITLFFAFAQSAFNGRQWEKRVAAACLSLFIACFLTAAQLLPSLEMLLRSDRQEQASVWPLELIQLANIPFPHFLGNDRQPGHDDFWGRHLFDRGYPLYYSLYMGFGGLILACFALRKRASRKTKILFWTGFLFFLISCGRYSPFFFLYRFAPIIGSIRYPVKFLLGSVFCLSILAAFGYESIERREEKKGARFPLFILIAAGFSSIYWAFKGNILSALNTLFLIECQASLHELGRSIETGLFLLSFYAFLYYFKEKNKIFRVVSPFLILFLSVLDPAFHNRYVNPTVPVAFFEKPKIIESLAPSKIIYREDSLEFLLKKEERSSICLFHYLYQTLYPFSGLGDDVRYVLTKDLYASYSRESNSLMKQVRTLPPESKLKILEYLGCSHAISEKRIFPHRPASELKVNGWTLWFEPITAQKPSAYLVFQCIAVATLNERIKFFIDPSFDPRRQAVTAQLLHLEGAKEKRGEEKFPLQVRKEIQGRAWYSVETPADALLIVPGNYAPGWRAWVDGKPTKVLEANLFSKAIPIPRGGHLIEIRYLPLSFFWGAIISFLSLALVFAALLAFSIRRRLREKSSGG
ncbi:MAG: YfhO family protein [Candidatus Aminicenantales bacterium]